MCSDAWSNKQLRERGGDKTIQKFHDIDFDSYYEDDKYHLTGSIQYYSCYNFTDKEYFIKNNIFDFSAANPLNNSNNEIKATGYNTCINEYVDPRAFYVFIIDFYWGLDNNTSLICNQLAVFGIFMVGKWIILSSFESTLVSYLNKV